MIGRPPLSTAIANRLRRTGFERPPFAEAVLFLRVDIQSVSSEVDTGSRHENASIKNPEPRFYSIER